MASDGSVIHFPAYDGNGNITAYTDGSSALAASYEYSPFGALTASSGSTFSPFRFSTKCYNTLTGLYYYGFRYYSPRFARWINRDPIGEEGGINLYGMVGNDAVNWVDVLGLGHFKIIKRDTEEGNNIIKNSPKETSSSDKQRSLRVTTRIGGFEVQYLANAGECPGKGAKLVLTQHKSTTGKKGTWISDNHGKERYRNNDKSSGERLVGGYTDVSPSGNRGIQGNLKPTNRTASYYDTPEWKENMYVKVQVYCRCGGKSDRFLGSAKFLVLKNNSGIRKAGSGKWKYQKGFSTSGKYLQIDADTRAGSEIPRPTPTVFTPKKQKKWWQKGGSDWDRIKSLFN